MMQVAVLIPCFNEESSISKVVHDFQVALPDATVYVYDNNSTDRTAELARLAGATVRSERRQGKGHVIRRMFREIEADVYLLVDGDDTYPADQAPLLIEAVAQRQADMVVGDRLSTTYFAENKRPFHNSGNRIVRSLICHLWHTDIHDILTGYRAFSRRFVKLFPVMTGNFEIETEMTIHALDKRFVIEEIPIRYHDRKDGSVSKLNTFSDGRKVLGIIFNLFKEYRPLRFFSWMAAILSAIAIVLLIPVFAEYFRTGLVPRFPTLIAGLLLLVVALMCYFTGLCLDVMAAKDRKQYELRVIEYEEQHLAANES